MPHLGLDWAELQACWEKVRNSGHWTEGYFVRALEEEVSNWCGLHAVAVNSAGTGLYAMLRMADMVTRNGAVVVPNNTFFATGAMVRECQREIVLADCTREDFSMAFDALPKRPVDAVVLTHVGGGLARDYAKIAGFCRSNGIMLFEDAAHALGVGGYGETAGSLSDGAVFSLYPTKAIPAGEGGIIVTRSAPFAERLREFRNYGKHRDSDGVIRYRRTGFNFRMDEWTAAVAWLQMRRRAEILERRDAAARKLMQIVTPILDWGGKLTNWYKFAIHADEARELGIKRFTGKVYQRSDQLAAALGISLQGPFPNSEWVADNHVCLPLDENSYEGMSRDDILNWLRSAP